MAFFDKITKVTQDAVRGAKDMTDVARLNSLISEEQKKIDILFNQIGKTFYEENKENVPAAFTDFFASLQEAQEKMESYNEEIKKIKGTKICVKCGVSNPVSSSFCINCGAPMESQDETSAQKFCTNCGTPIEAGAAFCLSCGTKI